MKFQIGQICYHPYARAVKVVLFRDAEDESFTLWEHEPRPSYDPYKKDTINTLPYARAVKVVLFRDAEDENFPFGFEETFEEED